jgi:predicted nucleic acid-binding protein
VTPDTSVVVAGFAAWHPDFARAHAALTKDAAEVRLVAHVALESYATLTRLPDPYRASASIAAEYIEEGFTGARLTLPQDKHDDLLRMLATAGVTGGASYDALIALTAAHHGIGLWTLDRRAQATYRRVGAAHELL